jgi:protein involved in polysaccharide export with SLBB domain
MTGIASLVRRMACALWGVAALFALNGVAGATDAPSPPSVPPAGTAYHLDSGDKIKVTVYGEDDLSGEYQIDGSGNVRLPLIGEVHAAGLTTSEVENVVEDKLSHGYLISPRVSAEVSNYRPFTILGEVNKPGEYPYENGMTVLNAVALAGGYTYRAEEDTVYIRRKGSAKEDTAPADDKTSVNPGDTIRVAERIF